MFLQFKTFPRASLTEILAVFRVSATLSAPPPK